MKHLNIIVGLIAMVFLFLGCRKPSKPEKPNILFIFSDDHALHAIGAYGPKHNNQELNRFVQTPNIDRIASEGMLFENVFCTNSICGPSRAAILTGKYNHLNGMISNGIPFDGSQQTFPKLFQQGGYSTAWIGKWHLISDPTGFDYWSILTQHGQQGTYYNPIFKTPTGMEPETGYTSSLITNRAIEWLESNHNTNTNTPFFLAYSHKAPHREWVPAPEDYALYKNIDLPVPSNFFDDYATRSSALQTQEMEIARHMNERDLKLIPPGYLNNEQLEVFMESYGPENEDFRRAGLTGDELALWKYQRYVKDFLRTVTSMDREIGRILDYLEESGLAENTIVIYSSDQGFYLGDHGWYDKRWMYEESLRMPLIIRWPGKIKPGSKLDNMIQNIDFAPTFLQMAGLEIPDDINGKSFLPLLDENSQTPWRDIIYYHYLAYPDWHMVKPHYGIRSDRYKLIHYYTIDEWELFDLKTDPDEMLDVYNDPEYVDILKNMVERLNSKRVAIGDTLEMRTNTIHQR